MKIDLVFPVLPPTLDGIGDHTARLAEALAAEGDVVRVLTAQEEADPIPGVRVRRAYSLERRRGIRRLAEAVREDPPDWLFVQFNQFSYGRWGLNPYLPLTLRKIKRSVPQMRIAWMAHENFMPPKSLKFAVMTLWQRWQFQALGRTADLILFPIEYWIGKYRTWFRDTPVRHLPVGSNIPRMNVSRREARRHLGIGRKTFVAGLFGSARGARALSSIRRAAEALHQQTRDFMLLYVGVHGHIMQNAMEGLPLRDAGPLPAEEVSVHLSAMDLHLTPFAGGISTRRGSFMTGLQHGIATVGTLGRQTDRVLLEENGRGFLLVDEGDATHFVCSAVELFESKARRARVARRGQQFYQRHFDWPLLAARLRKTVHEVDAHGERTTAASSSSTAAATS